MWPTQLRSFRQRIPKTNGLCKKESWAFEDFEEQLEGRLGDLTLATRITDCIVEDANHTEIVKPTQQLRNGKQSEDDMPTEFSIAVFLITLSGGIFALHHYRDLKWDSEQKGNELERLKKEIEELNKKKL
jgi:hypothetical protein